MSNDELRLLLNSIDRNYPVGKHDYAITRCLSDLRIRTSEVVNIGFSGSVTTFSVFKVSAQKGLF
jgi:hypothetical protein